MPSTAMMKQILDFNKKAFDESFSVLITVREHTEKMVRAYWEKSLIFPGEGKKAIEDWLVTYKNGLDAFKEDVDKRFETMESYLLNAGDLTSLPLRAAAEKKAPVKKSSSPKKNKVVAAKKAVRVRQPVKKVNVPRKKTAK
jgi:hypothetical protein